VGLPHGDLMTRLTYEPMEIDSPFWGLRRARIACLVVLLGSCSRDHSSILRFEFRPEADPYRDVRLLAAQVEAPGGTYTLTSAEFSDGRAEGAPTAKLELTRPGPARVRVFLRASPAETLATAAFDVRLAPDSAWDVVITPGWVPFGPSERVMMSPRRHVVVPIRTRGRAADSMLVRWSAWSVLSPSISDGAGPRRGHGDIAARSTDHQSTVEERRQVLWARREVAENRPGSW
jgi:hypothetical protein